MKIKNIMSLLAFMLIAFANIASAEPPEVFVDPPSNEYFASPPGQGKIRICKNDDGPDVKIRILSGTDFADHGPVKAENPAQPQEWLLTVVTTKSLTLKAGQKCGTITAHATYTRPPYAYPHLKSVLRFRKDDNRRFRVLIPVDDDSPLPNLGPWNPRLPSVSATAVTDFK